LDRPVGNIDAITTFVCPRLHKGGRIEPFAGLLGQEFDDTFFSQHEALDKHFEEEPIDLPNKTDPHHPDNHRHILYRVKKWIAKQI
jgi:hypothetical protein